MTDSETPNFEWRRASVIAVLSGDTICIKYTGFEQGNKVIKIAGCQAPNLSFFTSSGIDEPFGIESWKALRSILKSKIVLIRTPEISRSTELIKVPLIGELEVITTEVRTANDGKDVCERLIANGCAKHINDFDSDRLAPLAKLAKSKNLGIWSSSKKLEVTAPVIETIYQEETEFSAFLTDFDNNCIATLYLPEDTAIVELEVCGIFMPSMPPDLRLQVNKFLADLLLSEHLRVRILQINKKKMLVGVITVNGHDLASILLQKGYAMLNEATSFLRSDSDNLEVFEKRAISRKLGLWQSYPPLHDPPIPTEFEGTIIEVITSSKLSIRPKETQREYVITLNAIAVPNFGISVDSEQGGYEAFEFLREQVGKVVRVEVNDTFQGINYGTVYIKGQGNSEQMIQEYLVKHGLATICASGVIKSPKGMKLIESAVPKTPPVQRRAITFAVPTDMQLLEFVKVSADSKKHGVIMAVYSPMSFLIDILETNYRVMFTLKDIEAFSPEEYVTEVAVDYLRTNYLNREVIFTISGSDVANGTISGYFGIGEQMTDIRIDLLKNGYVKLLKESHLKQYEKMAAEAKVGDWSRAKRLFPIPPQPPALVSVYITKVIDPLTVAVQTKQSSMNAIRFESLEFMMNPKPGILVLFVRNNFAYRAMVKRVEGHAVLLHLIDFGFCVKALVEELRRITDNLSNIQAIGMTMKLAFLSLFDTNQDLVVKYLHNMLGNRQPLHAHVVKTASSPEVVLTVAETLESMSVQYLMIRDGAAKPGRDIPDTDHPIYGELIRHLLEAEKTAKTSELGFYSKKY